MFWPKHMSEEERAGPVILLVTTLKGQSRNTVMLCLLSDLGEISVTEAFEVSNLISK